MSVGSYTESFPSSVGAKSSQSSSLILTHQQIHSINSQQPRPISSDRMHSFSSRRLRSNTPSRSSSKQSLPTIPEDRPASLVAAPSVPAPRPTNLPVRRSSLSTPYSQQANVGVTSFMRVQPGDVQVVEVEKEKRRNRLQKRGKGEKEEIKDPIMYGLTLSLPFMA